MNDARNTVYLLVGLAVSVALYLLTRSKRGQELSSELSGDALDEVAVTAQRIETTVARFLSRGLRLNNPFNIRQSADTFNGEKSPSSDPTFKEFQGEDARYGVRAGLVILRNYQRKYGLNTIRELIGRWAPPGENPTAAYIDNGAARVGVSPDTYIDLYDTSQVLPLLRAMARQENGIEAELVPDSVFYTGIALA